MISTVPVQTDADSLEVLDRVQRRVLWLATSMIHYANKIRESNSEIKIGGHQASSASMVSIMSALYFAHLRPEDRVSVKPHAAPVFHAIQYLLGQLDQSYLTRLRSFHGLQSYPSRTKDPDIVDFSTGSVGIGATATIWSALSQRYLSGHFESQAIGRHIALIGDAELDEGAIWEAVVDPITSCLGELLWVVDVNRQSLDRVVPNFEIKRRKAMFEAAGWHTIEVKYGRFLRELFSRDGGEALQRRIDSMSNEEYQRLLRSPAEVIRQNLPGNGPDKLAIGKILDQLNDREVYSAIRDLAGHDLADLLDAFRLADSAHDRPTVIFAYTIKAWSLPTEGHPDNHSSLLTQAQWEELADSLGTESRDPWSKFEPGSKEADLCHRAAERLKRPLMAGPEKIEVPVEIGGAYKGKVSTQQALGRFLVGISRAAPEVASRIVTVSPDVASSTNLGGWINKVGIWNVEQRDDWFGDVSDVAVHWRETPTGQHVELGIAETNLVGMLGELGATWSRYGKTLFPIGTIYDPFVGRSLEPWSFGIYSGGQSILIGTPSGVTLAPEGGAHQSVITPSIGLEQPGCVAWEPAFAQDLEWTLLSALSQLGRPDGTSSYFRLTTRPIDQNLADVPLGGDHRELRRRQVLAGGYRLIEAKSQPMITIVGMGAVMPEAVAAADQLSDSGVGVDLICLTSADLIFRAFASRKGFGEGDDSILDILFPAERKAPIISVMDGHPHTLSFLSGIHGVQITSLGVRDFGQVGEISDLYKYFGIDTETIVGAAWDLLDTTQ